MNAFLVYSSRTSSLVLINDVLGHALRETLPELRNFHLLTTASFGDVLKELFEILPEDMTTRCNFDSVEIYTAIREAVILGWNTATDFWKKSQRMTSELYSEYIAMTEPPQLVYEVKGKAEMFGFNFNKEIQTLTVRQVHQMLIACFQVSFTLSHAD